MNSNLLQNLNKGPGKKVLIIALLIACYVILLRPIRNTLFAVQLDEDTRTELLANENLEIVTLEVRAVIFEYKKPDGLRKWFYKIPFGIFFLGSVIGLIILDGNRNFFWVLIGLHGVALLGSSLVLMAAAKWNPNLLMITDMLTRYFIPFCSLGFIPLAYIQKREAGT